MSDPLPFDILFEDNHLLILNKPAGLLSQPSGTDLDSLQEMARQWIKTKYQKPGNVFLEAVHRLDRPASGIVVFAKTSKALSRLNEALRNKQFQKRYLALVEGKLSQSEGVLEHFLVHGDHEAFEATPVHPGAKLAKLRYRVVSEIEGNSLLEIDLETGRYHQIRAQLSAIRHPIVGDHKYRSRTSFRDGCIALHHYRLQMPHPVTKELCSFEAPSPFKHQPDIN